VSFTKAEKADAAVVFQRLNGGSQKSFLKGKYITGMRIARGKGMHTIDRSQYIVVSQEDIDCETKWSA